MDNTIQLYLDKKKEIKGYPITSPDRVIDENGVNIKDEIEEINSSLDNMMVNIKLYGAIGKDNIDDTRAIQDCIDKVAEHGGYVYIPSGCFMVSQLILKSNVIIKGSGYKSQLKQIGNTHANMIILENPTTHTCGLENLYINGNHGEQTVANDGINFINSSQEIGYEQLIDHYITLRDVHIEKFKGNGLVMKYGREIVLDNVTVRQCGSTGIYLNISDSKISNCTVSTSKIGYHFDMSGNLRVVNSKAFVCDTGFMVNSYGASCNLLTNTETQSCLTGYYFKNVIGVNLNNFVSDSEDNGIILENAENCYINGIINSKAEWGGNNKVGIRNKGKLRNTHININRYFNTRSGYVDLVDEYNEVIPSSTIKVNNQEIYNINCFSFSHFESVKNKCFNTMEMLKSNENINLDISYKQGSTKLEISSNPQMDNWGSVELIEKEFRPIIKGCKISLCADFDVIGDLIPTVNIQLFGDDGYSRGKRQGYLLDNNKTAYICVIPQDLPTDATKFKISVGYNFPQTTEQNEAIGWGVKISNIQCTVY